MSLFCRISSSKKTLGITTVVLLIGSFIIRTMHEYKTQTGIIQFSAFSGWQLASNALFSYTKVKPNDLYIIPPKFQLLHKIVNMHMDSLRHEKNRPDESLGSYYLWNTQSPLTRYMLSKLPSDTVVDDFKEWA